MYLPCTTLWYWTQIGQFNIELVYILKLGLLGSVEIKKVISLFDIFSYQTILIHENIFYCCVLFKHA
jgi:hypothetical protein